jgi:outer membrane protein assembly factor BamB
MKKLLFVFISLVFFSCSFDNKTGIWNDASDIPKSGQASKSILENSSDTKYENILIKDQAFNEEKELVSFFDFQIDESLKIKNWLEQYAISTNNISNFAYSGKKILLSKSSKLSKSISNNKIIFYNDNLISHDHKGKIFVFSLTSQKKIFEYSFYKKKFKNINIKINFIVNDNFLYAADNLGYLYAINLKDKSIAWAKNYGIPFRSNIKFANNQIFLANQDNVIYSINPNNGEKNWQFSTSLTFLKSNFENNFALDLANNNLFFLNTSGELYSINYLTQKINWVLNFKNTSLTSDTDLFLSHPLVIKNNNLIVSIEKGILSYDTLTANKNWNLPANPIFKPIITRNNSYILLKNDLLICLDNINGDVIWSKNIIKNIEEKKIKNKLREIIDFKIVNSEINIYLKNGYLLSLDPKNGNLNSLNRINKKGISSEIFFLDNNMLFFDSSNRLLRFN